MKRLLFVLWMGVFWYIQGNKIHESDGCSLVKEEKMFVHKKVLKNGFTVLVRPLHNIPKVATKLFYNVGSRDESDSERGIAHLLEHMIFKGTKRRSECDINETVHLLGGDCNAFTSHDYTGYEFNFPTQHWHEALDILSDCMKNCTFKEEMLSSEMKAVIQELKMYKDRHMSSLIETLVATIFADHPYHHPIIGYKQDLWSVHSEDLHAFYRKHYVPNNAHLVVVGDVEVDEVFKLAESYFGSIKADSAYERKELYCSQDIVNKSVILHRDIKQPVAVQAYRVPGLRAQKDLIYELLALILGKGKSSRLYKKLVDQMQIATAVSASYDDMFDHALFFISFEAKENDMATINTLIHQEIAQISEAGISDEELERALKLSRMEFYETLEDFEQQAYQIGKYFSATGNEQYIFTQLDRYSKEELKQEILYALKNYFRPSIVHAGTILPLQEQEREQWVQLQELSDEEDRKILSARVRTTPVEEASYTLSVEPQPATPFAFPKPEIYTLKNGLKLFAYHNESTPKVDLILELKSKGYEDPDDKLGRSRFTYAMLTEGTQNYTAEQLADVVESKGMSLDVYTGGLSMSALAEDLPFGFEIMAELLMRAVFKEDEIEKVRAQLEARLKTFWDDPRYFASQLTREILYKGHPYAKNSMGTHESIAHMSHEDLLACYKETATPRGARLAIVGDLRNHDVRALAEKALGIWEGPEPKEIQYPSLADVKPAVVEYPINRDQINLTIAGLSVERKHPDYDALLLFDQIFGGGALGSMSSRLFDLREQSGLFYTIQGSLIAAADEQPGMVIVRTIVSVDRLSEAEKAIQQTMADVVESMDEDELAEACDAILSSMIDYFASNSSIASTFLYVDKYNLGLNYFDTRAQKLKSVTLDAVKKAAHTIMSNGKITLRIGRVEAAGGDGSATKNIE